MDIGILNWINANLHGIPFFNYLFKYITILGDSGVIWIIISLVLFCIKKTRKAGFIALCACASTLVVNNLILKNIFDRARPFTENPELAEFITSINLELPDSNSFPSGHTFCAFACSIALCMSLKKKWWFIYILAVLIAFSRVFLCVHYVTDVLAGAILGTLVGLGVYFLLKWLLPKFETWYKKRTTAREAHATIQDDEAKEK